MGYFHIKLGDMGTAKRVDDTQTFPSLVGTEEYLVRFDIWLCVCVGCPFVWSSLLIIARPQHPDMYIRYLEGFQTQHKASVDLWSIGVTLYHAIVTELPFIPHNYSRTSDRAKETL